MNVVELPKSPAELEVKKKRVALLTKILEQMESGELTDFVLAASGDRGFTYILGSNPEQSVLLSSLLSNVSYDTFKHHASAGDAGHV